MRTWLVVFAVAVLVEGNDADWVLRRAVGVATEEAGVGGADADGMLFSDATGPRSGDDEIGDDDTELESTGDGDVLALLRNS